jgi:hypothetical protein
MHCGPPWVSWELMAPLSARDAKRTAAGLVVAEIDWEQDRRKQIKK